MVVRVACGAVQWVFAVYILLSADESVLVGGVDGGLYGRRVGRRFRCVGRVSNSAGWPESCRLLLALLVRSGVRVEGC